MKETSLFWALKNNQTVHISEVLNGLKCGCVCPVCNGKLEAHKGQIKVHHFKHYEITNCKGALETSIHLASKRLFLAKKEVILPDLFADVPEFGYQKVQSKKLYKSKTVIQEHKVDDFQPDIFMEIEIKKKGKVYLTSLIIEIAVTHFVDAEKLSKIEKKGISAIEISLNKLDRIENDDELWTELTNPDNIKWLFHSKLSTLIEKKRINEVEHQKNIENYNIRKQEEKDREKIRLRQQNFSLFKIYNFRKDYSERDMDTGYTPFEGTVYCPKDKVNNENRKITLNECESCKFNFGKHFESTYSDSTVYAICGLRANKFKS